MRTPEDDAHLGRTVLERGLVAREALLECLFQMTLERKAGLPRPGFVAPLLYSLRTSPGAFLDITEGDNVVFGGINCCAAGPGYDMASGLGSPIASAIVTLLRH